MRITEVYEERREMNIAVRKSLREWFRSSGRVWNATVNAQLLEELPVAEQVEALLKGFPWRGDTLSDDRALR